ncbi:hypothetical protein ASF06_15760 [Agreia sp. Leaf244]|nr:hypothetical protein ASF06_15760 [Agreia sp. Leaf244]
MGDDSEATAPPLVHVVDSHDTAAIADEIIHGLDHLGVDASGPVPTADRHVRAVVILLSARALEDTVWLRRVELLRHERLVPVLVGQVSDDDVPAYIRELNWIIHSQGDTAFLARLFVGINTEASRFRDARDTRALSERWHGSGRSPDLLIDNLGEVNRRADLTRGATTTVEGVDQFLAASRQHAERLRRRRIWRASYRSGIALAAVAALVFTISVVQNGLRTSNNAVSFAFGDAAGSGRPDLAAIKAGGSLVDADEYPGSDGRLRIAVDALSRHWPAGFLRAEGETMVEGKLLADGSAAALTIDGSLWHWDEGLESRTRTSTGAPEILAGDISAAGDLVLATDGVSLTVATSGGDATRVAGIDSVQQLRLAPANDRALVESAGGIYSIDDISSESPTAVSLGAWDSVLDIVQTEDGSAVALAERDGSFSLVSDDGSVVPAGPAPSGATAGSVSSDGHSFIVVADGSIWYSTDGSMVSSGIVVSGAVVALQLVDDGVVLISDRTRGTWAGDVGLGLDLGAICQTLPRTASFASTPAGNQILCLQGTAASVDSLDDIRPGATAEQPGAAVTSVTSSASTARVGEVSLVDGFIRLDRADGTSFALDAAGFSLEPGFTRPDWIDDVSFFGTGALIQAESVPTSVALTPDGSTFAVGFVDGRVIEVDLSQAYTMATVGSWQLPDHAAVVRMEWSEDLATISATTDKGTTWHRQSCSGCWGSSTLTQHIADRVWFCYAEGDIAELGETSKRSFSLRDCESRWGSTS